MEVNMRLLLQQKCLMPILIRIINNLFAFCVKKHCNLSIALL